MMFRVKGSADLMIVDRWAEEYRIVFGELRLVIEVKQDLTGTDGLLP